MSKRLVFIVTAFTLFIMAKNGHCQEVKDIPPGVDKIVAVKEGETVPFTGQLYDSATALRWANWLQQYKFQVGNMLNIQRRICDAERKYSEAQLQAAEEKNTSVVADYKEQVLKRDVKIMSLEHELSNPPFYRTVWFGAIIGVVVTGAAFGVGVYAASQ